MIMGLENRIISLGQAKITEYPGKQVAEIRR
jgi:hypothetical protein